MSSGPWVALAILFVQLCNKGVDDCGWVLGDRFEDGRIHEGVFNRLVAKARAADPKRRSLFVFAVEDSTFKHLLKGGDRRFCDVAGEYVVAKGVVSGLRCPEKAWKEAHFVSSIVGGKDLVEQRAFC